MTAKELFERAVLSEHRIDAAKRKLELFKSMAEKVTSVIGDEQVSHTRDVTATENAIIRLMEAKEKVRQLESEYQAIIDETNEALTLLRNPVAETILTDYYLHHRSMVDISRDMHICRSWVYRCHDRAMGELDVILGKLATKVDESRQE